MTLDRLREQAIEWRGDESRDEVERIEAGRERGEDEGRNEDPGQEVEPARKHALGEADEP